MPLLEITPPDTSTGQIGGAEVSEGHRVRTGGESPTQATSVGDGDGLRSESGTLELGAMHDAPLSSEVE